MKRQRFEIERVPSNVGFEGFVEKYFEPERPVVIEGIGKDIQRLDDLRIDTIREKIIAKGLAVVNTYWFEGPSEMLNLLVDTPDIVSRLLSQSHVRKNHCRLWLNRAGNVTPSHYEGNLLYVFNLQLKGRKEWRIVSPHTPSKNYPFSRVAPLLGAGETSPAVKKGIQYSEFALEEGDMIYLPALWHHAVKATANVNVNVNWVGTRKSGYVNSKLLRREKELLKFALFYYRLTGRTRTLNFILGAGIKNYLENFAGVGWDFIREITEDIRMHRVATRILKELVMTPIVLKDLKKLRAQLRTNPLDSLQQNPSTATTSD